MFDTDDPRNIWVSPDKDDSGDGMGTHDDPFPSLSAALKKATPGQSIILMPGIYNGDRTIEVSGELKSPIYITAQKPGEAIVEGGCWYFYDTSDLVVSGLTFRNARSGAVSVVGQCHRNSFESLKFIDCGRDGGSSCTFYFGGAGGMCNVVMDCVFLRSDKIGKSAAGNSSTNKSILPDDKLSIENTTVGLMVSDGSDDSPLENYVIMRSHFSGYDRAIIVGSGEALNIESWHILDRNTIVNCRYEGITIRCGDVSASKNFISGCAFNGIDIAGGRNAMATHNRITNCGGGIALSGRGHSISGNHIVRCEQYALCAMGADGDLPAAENLLITDNKILQCGTAEGAGAFIIGKDTSGVIMKNHFYGKSNPWAFQSPDNVFSIKNNTEGISVDEYADEGIADEDTDAGNSYLTASIPDDDDDEADIDDDDDDDEILSEMDDVIKYMFNQN